MGSVAGWFWNFLLLFLVIGFVFTQLVFLNDLESDHLNPYDLAPRMRVIVLVEYIFQGLSCIVYLLTGHWFMFLLCLPYTYYNVMQFFHRQHIFDVTEIFNQLHHHKFQRVYKLSYLLVLFVISLFWLIWTVAVEYD